MAFLEKDESGHGLRECVCVWGGNRESSKEGDGYNKWSMCNGKTNGGGRAGKTRKVSTRGRCTIAT